MNKKDLRIVFLGTPDFAVESLQRLVDGGYNVVAVVTMPDKPAGRGHHLLQSPVKQFAVEHDLPVLQPANLKDQAFIDQLAAFHADLFIVIAFRMLPRAVWQMPPLGTFNLHASLLPQYRGAAPINWAVINGDKQTGVTTFMLKHEIDTGDILQQSAVDIGDDENVGSVHDRLMHLGADLTIDTVNAIINGALQPKPQPSADEVALRPAPKIFKDDCRIDWRKTSTEVHNFVRGLSPYPAAWTVIASDTTPPTEVKILESRRTDRQTSDAPGKVTIDGDHFLVACGDGRLIEVTQLRPAGKRQMAADAYLRGARLNNPRVLNV